MMTDHVPMPSGYRLAATVRESATLPDQEDLVARVTFEDVVGEQRVLDIKPSMALSLAADLLDFVRQVGL